MNTTRENISLWLSQAEPDYYLFFLKTWIPFNAWYVAEYPEHNKVDRDLIKELQDNIDSKPKKIIRNYLNNFDHDSLAFKSNLAELHYYLERIDLSHNGTRLTLKKIALTKNPVTSKTDTDIKQNLYKTEKTSSYFQAYIQAKGGKVLLDFKQPIYNIQDLCNDNDYLRLDKKIQKKIASLYEQIDPQKPISIISNTKNKKYITIKSKNSCKIIDDTDTVAKACIKVLYAMRCMLFHGEVPPNETNKAIYKSGFYLLQLIIKQLK